MASQPIIVGIDLGTTNSLIAVPKDEVPQLIPVDGNILLPSVVGIGADGALLVGQTARNQYVLYPERTVRSIKRKMGQRERIRLGDRELAPEEISAAILRKLKSAAEAHLGTSCERAVITVPAYFSDAQRTATKEAGEIAGFTVERIINEPTAAALCYAGESEADRTFLVYDLGGGTFDVSIVRARGDVTEVLASHGDTKLGGDDMDAALLEYVRGRFERSEGVSLAGDARALARLGRAVEEAKIRLSTESYWRIREEHLCEHEGTARHLDMEISRRVYEQLIEPLIERTKDSVQGALRDAGLLTRDLDDVILVGGASRTPMVTEMLHAVTRIMPRADVDPDKAVALGAGLQALRLTGHKGRGVLVDVTPFSFGTAYYGVLGGRESADCYKVIIPRNTPVPCQRTEVFYTMGKGQEAVDVRVYQGEQEDARENILIGRFRVDGLDPYAPANSPILFHCKLDLDGILEVEVIEKHTGLHKHVTIEDAFRRLSPEEIAGAQHRLLAALGQDSSVWPAEGEMRPLESAAHAQGAQAPAEHIPPPEDIPAEYRATWTTAHALLDTAHRVVRNLAESERAEVDGVVMRVRAAMAARDWAALQATCNELGDILFYLE